MSSTYSPILRTELIGAGDQAGSWGGTTNNNFQYIFESAIAGYQAITVSPTSNNQVLTYTNGPSTVAALDQSIYAFLKLNTGTVSANFNIYAPPVSKSFTIWNNTSYTATFYNSTVIGNTTAAGTGITIPAGVTTTIWSDGTNFYSSNTATVGNFSVTGNLSVGGTLTVTGASTFAGITATTGTFSGTLSGAGGAITAYLAATSTSSTIAGTVLTVGGTVTGAFYVGQLLTGSGVASGTYITSFAGGSGGTGTYNISISQTISTPQAINGTSGTVTTNNYNPGNLVVGGASALIGNVGIGGNLVVTGTSSIGGNTAITGTLSVTQDATFSGTGEIALPVGTTAQRSALPTYGMFRYNSTTNQFEGYNSAVGTTISTITFVTTTATLTTATNHGLSSGAVIVVTGATPAAYNGTFSITVTGSTTFTYTMASNPGANASPVGSYTTGYWGQVGGGAQAQGVVYENGQTITANYTMTSGNNGECAGPVSVATGITVTIPTGSRWVIN
jgi:hypothetical protein